MKNQIKKLIKKLPFAFTKNQQYDQQTKQVISKVLTMDSNCVDIGCHKGEVLEIILKYAPKGQHFGFEPIPEFFNFLEKKFPPNCKFYQCGLSNEKGSSTFNYVISNPAYSGIKKRRYDRPNEKDTSITIQINLLDDLLTRDQKIDLIKIDVEGAEYLVMQGAKKTIQTHQPIIIFEHGKGGADIYGIQPEMVYEFLNGECGLNISTMKNWLGGSSSFSKDEFIEQFEKGKNYYFIAYP